MNIANASNKFKLSILRKYPTVTVEFEASHLNPPKHPFKSVFQALARVMAKPSRPTHAPRKMVLDTINQTARATLQRNSRDGLTDVPNNSFNRCS